MFTEEQGRVIPVSKLQALLEVLPEGAMIAANAVGNLLVYSATFEYLGFIDMRWEEVHTVEDA